MPYRTLITCAFVLATSLSAAAQNSGAAKLSFRWLDRKADAALFGKIQGVFTDELKPDDPEKTKPYQALLYKYVDRIGILGPSALVLVGERETPADKSGDYFLAFNLNIDSGIKGPVTANGFPVWKFSKFAQFESSQPPDIVFTYLTCTECEAYHVMGSFRFDSKLGQWRLRKWNDKEDAIMIGSDTQIGSEEGDYDNDCVYSIADFDGDGFDDVAVRCVETLTAETGKPPKVTGDTMKLYSVKNGEPKVSEIHDPIQMSLIRRKLCSGSPKSPLCKSR